MNYKFLAILSVAGLTAFAMEKEVNLTDLSKFNKSDAKRVTVLIVRNTDKGASLPSMKEFSRLKVLAISGPAIKIDQDLLPKGLTTLACTGCENIEGIGKSYQSWANYR